MHYVAGQEVMVFTADDFGKLGPFMNEVTGQPVTPTGVQCKFRLEPAGQVTGVTNTVVFGSAFNFDPYNPAVAIQQDTTTKGYWLVLITTGFFANYAGAASINLRTQWVSVDPTNPACSQSKLDTVYPADL
jgi:hypothetical protein